MSTLDFDLGLLYSALKSPQDLACYRTKKKNRSIIKNIINCNYYKECWHSFQGFLICALVTSSQKRNCDFLTLLLSYLYLWIIALKARPSFQDEVKFSTSTDGYLKQNPQKNLSDQFIPFRVRIFNTRRKDTQISN